MTGTKTAKKPRASTGTRAKSKATAKTTAKKTTRAKTTAKTTTPAARKKAPAAAPVAPKLVAVKEPVLNQPDLRKKDLIDEVVERAGIKKKDAKPAIEAALAILGEALADGRDLNLRPLGKLKVQRREEKSNGTVIVCRVRQPSRAVPKTPGPVTHAAE